jgi:hypothetical protein
VTAHSDDSSTVKANEVKTNTDAAISGTSAIKKGLNLA